MSLNLGFDKGKITPEGLTLLSNLIFSFHCEGTIWKTAFDPFTGKLALEIRDVGQFSLSYQILNLKDQTISGPVKFVEADWWSSLLIYKEGYLFIEKYQDNQSPLHKDLLVYDEGKDTLKVYPGFQLTGYENGILNMQKVLDPDDLRQETLGAGPAEAADSELILPSFFTLDSPAWEVVRQYLDNPDLVLGCEYLEHNNYIIIGYYVRSGKEFVRKLLVIRDEEEWVHEVQDTELNGFAPGSFFIFSKYLMFISERNRINVIEL